MNPPTHAPTINELQASSVVQQALAQAWTDSLPDDPNQRHEEGGGIYMDLDTGELTVRRAPAGQQGQLEVGQPPLIDGSVIVGVFHTHPNPSAEGWDPEPSPSDRAVHAALGVPGLIHADDGVHVTGPPSRRGGLRGAPGFPA
jgi:hypothetical protein